MIKLQIDFDDFRMLAGYFLSVMEGDTHLINSAYDLIRKYDLLDEDGYLKCEEETEEQVITQPKPKSTDA